MKQLIKPLILAAALSPTLLFAETGLQVVNFSSVSPDKSYGLLLMVAPGDCPATRFMVLGEGVQAVSAPMESGQSAVLPLGSGFAAGDYRLEVSAIGCAARATSVHLITLNQSGPSHGRAPALDLLDQ